jgi:hypothetical protein
MGVEVLRVGAVEVALAERLDEVGDEAQRVEPAVGLHDQPVAHLARQRVGLQGVKSLERVLLVVLGDLLLERVGDLALLRRQRPGLRRRTPRGGRNRRPRRPRRPRAEPLRQLVVGLPLREELLLRVVRRRVELLLQPGARGAAAQREVLERSLARDPDAALEAGRPLRGAEPRAVVVDSDLGRPDRHLDLEPLADQRRLLERRDHVVLAADEADELELAG